MNKAFRGVEKWLSRWFHKPEKVGSVPTAATKLEMSLLQCLCETHMMLKEQDEELHNTMTEIMAANGIEVSVMPMEQRRLH